MNAHSPLLPSLLQELHQLSQRLNETNDPEARHELLKEMRMLLGDADKIVGSEMGED